MDISFVVANYNGRDCLAKCLDSLLSQNYPKDKFEVIVVDDASPDDSWKIAKRYKRIKLIRNKKNVKFVETNNIGIRASSGKFVALINNDISLEKDWLKKMMGKMREDSEIAILGCKILYAKSKKVWFGGSRAYFPGFVKHLNSDKEIVTEYVAFAAALIRKSGLGGSYLDSNLVMYAEDSELCKRLRRKGFKIVYYPKARAFHHISEERISKNEEFYVHRNRGYLYTKYYSKLGKWIFIIFDVMIFYYLFAFYRILKNPKRIRFLDAILKARLESLRLMLRS